MNSASSEQSRLAALAALDILDTSPEPEFNELARSLTAMLAVPGAWITFIDRRRQWIKAHQGWSPRELPREQSLCAGVLQSGRTVVIPDTLQDPALSAHPFVISGPRIRSYASAPIADPAGNVIGTCCVYDSQPRSLTPGQVIALEAAARHAHVLCRLRRALNDLQSLASDQKDARQALQNSEAIYHSLVETLPQNIFRKDCQGRFIFANQRFCATVGKPPLELLGKTDREIFPPEMADKYQRDDRRVLETGETIDVVEEHMSAQRGRLHVHVVKTPLYDQSGRIIGLQGIFWDVTEKHLAERELGDARDAALQSARLKSEFLANMSHEIRTPLNAIVGMSSLLMDTPLDLEQQDFANTIRTSADALLSIVNDILDFSKIEAGKLVFESIEFDLRELVESTAEIFAEPAEKKGIELAIWYHPEVPRYVRGDPSRLRQIMTNLVSNAIKFTDRGEVLLDVDTEGGHLQFSVKDTGIGIPPEAHAYLFQPFTQADGSMTRKYGGTGLGLAICKQLVGLMRGEIDFESVLRSGTTFWVTVPLVPATETSMPAATALDRDILVGLRVLIVDDNQTTRRILNSQVMNGGMRHGSAGDAETALTLLRNAVQAGDPYRVALIDRQMPGIEGLELAHLIKSDPGLREMHLIVLTSMAQRLTTTELQAAGLDAYLVKPVKESRLFDVLAGVMSHKIPPAPEPLAPAVNLAEDNRANRMRILLAEDHPVNQKVAVRQLSSLGYQADAVANGLEVITALAQVPYDVILMDCQMPELDGYKTASRIRQLEAEGGHFVRPHRHYIIAMTANAMMGDREKCLASGMDDYLTKPVRVKELASALERATYQWDTQRIRRPPSVDTTVLRELRSLPGQGEKLLNELIVLFIRDGDERMARLAGAIERDDLAEVEMLAHTMKGSAGNLGGKSLASLCGQLEASARSGSTDNAAVFGLIRNEYERVKTFLSTQRSK